MSENDILPEINPPIEIRKLTPELAEDYVNFFDLTPHDDNIDAHKCYCVCWCADDCEGKDFSTREKRREAAFQYVRNQNLQGYLAYHGNEVVGWCNANTKADCLKCCSWRRYMNYVPLDDIKNGVNVKSIFCFVIAQGMKRKGIATRLLNRVCEDAYQDGFDYVEAYPSKNPGYQPADFKGHFDMYKKNGFLVSFETEKNIVVKKLLR